MKSANHPIARWNLTTSPVNMDRLLYLGLFLTALASGCAHDYVWKEYRIEPERISLGTLPPGTAVTLVNDQPDTEIRKLGSLGWHHWDASLSQLTDVVITQLSQELANRGAVIREGADKTLKIAVLDGKYTEGMWIMRTEMLVRYETGDGYMQKAEVANRTPEGGVAYGYNSAIAVVVINILNDPAIAGYLKN